MRDLILLFFLFLMVSCQTVKVKNSCYKISDSNIEFGAVGQSKSLLNIKNDFSTRSIVALGNKIRVSVDILPFDKKLNTIYRAKKKYDQSQAAIEYIDSLPVKPEITVIRVIDITGLINEISAENNKDLLRLMQDVKKPEIVTSVVTTFSKDEMARLRQADACYIINTNDKKLALVLYKQGKKLETMEIKAGSVLSYQLSKCCWAVNEKGNWYLADLVEGENKCKGKTKSKIKEKERMKSLYRM